MRFTVLYISLMCTTFSFAKDANLKSKKVNKQGIAMVQKKRPVSYATALPFDRPTPMTSDVLKAGRYEGVGTVGNVPSILK